MRPGDKVVAIAQSQLGVREEPLGSNRGPAVDEYNRVANTFVAASPGAAWCMSFVYWCYARACADGKNPMPRTAYCPFLYDWARARGRLVDEPRPGDIFLVARDGRHCHTGIVESVADDRVVTVEGNTNEAGLAEGIGVFRRERARDDLEFVCVW